MDLRQLRYFIALLEHRSFVRAADAIGITQPAFSRSIQGLEQEFGCALVDRGNKDLRPTPEGQLVLQHALRLVQGAANLSSEIDQMTKLDAGDLRFGCGPAPAARLVPSAVAQFVKQHPRISLSFEVDNWEKLGRSLSRDEIEFFIADITQFEADPNFHTQAITPRRGVYFCRPGHPLLAKESLSTNDMFDYPIAAPKIPARARKYLANLSGRTDYHPTVTCEHLPSLVDIVRNTDAIGIATEEFFGQELQRGELVRLYWRNLPTTVDESLQARCGIVSRAGYRLSAAARAMIAMIIEVDSELGQPPAGRTQAQATQANAFA